MILLALADPVPEAVQIEIPAARPPSINMTLYAPDSQHTAFAAYVSRHFVHLFGVDTSMAESPDQHPYRLLAKAAVLSSIQATLLTAVAMAWFSGSGYEHQFQGGQGSQAFYPLQFAGSALWLCYFAALNVGPFGFLSGFAGAFYMKHRLRLFLSSRRFVAESAATGLIFGILFPFYDAISSPVGFAPAETLLAPFFGGISAAICALVFRKRFLAAFHPAAPPILTPGV